MARRNSKEPGRRVEGKGNVKRGEGPRKDFSALIGKTFYSSEPLLSTLPPCLGHQRLLPYLWPPSFSSCHGVLNHPFSDSSQSIEII